MFVSLAADLFAGGRWWAITCSEPPVEVIVHQQVRAGSLKQGTDNHDEP